MEEYKISIGVQLETDDLKKQIESAGTKADPIKINIDDKHFNEQIDNIKKQLQNLGGGKGKKATLTLVDTASLEKSITDVSNTIKEIKSSIGNIDSKRGVQSLLTSINKISTALQKASKQFDGLNANLNSLAKKDFNIDFGIKLGGNNPVANNMAYSDKVKRETLPQLKQQYKQIAEQIKSQKKLRQEWESVALSYATKGSLGTGISIMDDVIPDLSDKSLKKRMEAYRTLINMMQKAASIDDIDLSPVTSKLSQTADEMVEDAKKIATGEKQIEENVNRLQKMISGGIDAERLSSQLESIVLDLNEIKTAIQGLSSGNSLDGLTQSFNNLSSTLEKLTNNFDAFKYAVNTGLSGTVNNVDKISDSVTKQTKKSAVNNNIDNNVDKEVLNLMEQFGVVGNKGSKAFNEIKTALIEYKNSVISATATTDNLGDEFDSFGNASFGIGKVTDSLLNNIKVVNENKEAFKDLVKYIKEYNASGGKIIIPDSVKSEYQDDFRSMRSSLGKAFTTNKSKSGIGFDVWLEELNERFPNMIDMSQGIEYAFGDLVKKYSLGTGSKFTSGHDLSSKFKNNVANEVDAAVNRIISAEQKVENASDASTSSVIQNEEKKQQAYKATAENVVYHAGAISRLNKAESNGKFYGSDRGTGYFGTGHYFVDYAHKGRELDNSRTYSKLPYNSVDISSYDNLFRVTSDELGYELHNFLRNITRFSQGSESYDISELFTQFKSVFGDTIMDAKEFGNRLNQLKSFMSNSDFYDRSDSVSTQFMKSLGYGGVDTRGTSLADTRYGTVIYDLKEESVLQANITDELQKQGQMLEKINYEKGQVFDKDIDAKIQSEIDAQNKKREIQEEFNSSFDSSNFEKSSAELDKAQNRIREINDIIDDCQYVINNADKEAQKFARDMAELGLEVSDKDIEDHKKFIIDDYQDSINNLSKEKADLESKIPSLEESYNREAQLANEAMEIAKQVVEQRHQEAQAAQENAAIVIQNEQKKQQEYQETLDAIEKLNNEIANKKQELNNAIAEVDSYGLSSEDSDKAKATIAEVNKLEIEELVEQRSQLESQLSAIKEAAEQTHNELKQIENIKLRSTPEQIGNMKDAMGDFGFDESSINKTVREIEKMNLSVDKIKTKLREDGSVTLTVSGIDEFGNAVTAIRNVRKVEEELEDGTTQVKTVIKDLGTTIVQEFNKVAKQPQDVIEAFKELKAAAQQIDNLKFEIAGLDSSKNANEIAELTGQLNRLESEYDDLFRAFEKDFSDEQFRELSNASQTAADKINKLKAQMADTSAVDKQKQAFKELNAVADEMDAISKKIAKLKIAGGNDSQIEGLEQTLDELRTSYEQTMNSLEKPLSNDQMSALLTKAIKTKEAIEQINRAAIDLSSNHAKDIASKVLPTGKYTKEVRKLETVFNSISNKTDESIDSINRLKTALENMQDAATDDKRIEAEITYQKALQDTKFYLDINKQAEQDENSTENLNLSKEKALLRLKGLFGDGSEAAKRFGSEVQRLEKKINECGNADGIKNINKEIDILSSKIRGANVQTQTFVDRIRTQFQKYSAYFGVAEVFMYVEQGLRDMFEQVKAIDSAMTELKKVTDETDDSYNKFLSNAAERAKEIGTTIDGLVDSTAEFAKIGYSFEDSQGLAEVANIYTVVGDNIESVEDATLSLISTMAAFKDEMNGMSNPDFAMSIVDKFNEVSNKYSIGSGGLGEALTRSASSMAAANNTLDETIALITAARLSWLFI